MHHPESKLLEAFGKGTVPSDDKAAIETHLSECAVCCATLQTLLALSSDELEPEVFVKTGRMARAAVTEPPLVLKDHPRYQVLAKIGDGGMGVVFRGRHRLMDRDVALKVMRPHLLARPEAVERFYREVKTAARLPPHPHVVMAFDADRAGDLHFLVMEHVEGTNLAQFVRDRGRLSVSEACRLIQQACCGLEHAWKQGMVHRDIKPHNLLLTPEGQVKIVDFGLAECVKSCRTDGDAAHIQDVVGSPDYIAPEQILDPAAVDIRADLYGLGCTLHFLLTGEPPFPGGTVVEKLMRQTDQSPPALRDARPDAPAELEELLQKLMAKEPGERYATPGELHDALQPWCKPLEIRKKPRAFRLRLVFASWLTLSPPGVWWLQNLFGDGKGK